VLDWPATSQSDQLALGGVFWESCRLTVHRSVPRTTVIEASQGELTNSVEVAGSMTRMPVCRYWMHLEEGVSLFDRSQ
jgi:hypothetical protein